MWKISFFILLVLFTIIMFYIVTKPKITAPHDSDSFNFWTGNEIDVKPNCLNPNNPENNNCYAKEIIIIDRDTMRLSCVCLK